MPQTLPWIIGLAALALGAGSLLGWWARSRRPQPASLPTEWTLTARPVFSTDERRAYRQLREALPQHIVLSKLPLVRFTQPTQTEDLRFWYELLGTIHVSFAICSANGRVLAAIDLDADQNNSRRVLQIKQSALAACRVRYLRCPADHLPSIPELQLLVPQSSAAARAPLPDVPAARRRERSALWQDSGLLQDSFFAADSRRGSDGSSEFGTLGSILRGDFAAHGPRPGTPGDESAAASGA